jgi:hypothetical protein
MIRTELRDAAVAYARAGIPVLALWPRAKEPYTAHGKDDATTDLDLINQLWSRKADLNVGVRPPAALGVLDVDVQHGGPEALTELCYEHGPLPDTWTAQTGQGGRHIWLRADGPFRGKLCTGVDIKSHSGYLVAPPSVHPNGRRYEWVNRLPIAHAPDWLRPLLAPPPPRPRPSRQSWGSSQSGDALVRFVATASDGNRNRALFWAAKTATAEGVIDAIEDALTAAAVSIGLDEAAAEATIKSGIRHGQRVKP